jgi:DNA-binding MarR family transcriptional regulator
MSKDETEREGRFFAAVQLTRPLLRHITGAVEEGLSRWNISVGQRAILEALLFHPDCSLPELTAVLVLKRQFIHRVLQEVITSGMVASSPSPSRRGARIYRLSPRGEEAIRTIRAEELDKLRVFLAGHPEADIDAFIRVQAALDRYFHGLAQGEYLEGEEAP